MLADAHDSCLPPSNYAAILLGSSPSPRWLYRPNVPNVALHTAHIKTIFVRFHQNITNSKKLEIKKQDNCRLMWHFDFIDTESCTLLHIWVKSASLTHISERYCNIACEHQLAARAVSSFQSKKTHNLHINSPTVSSSLPYYPHVCRHPIAFTRESGATASPSVYFENLSQRQNWQDKLYDCSPEVVVKHALQS